MYISVDFLPLRFWHSLLKAFIRFYIYTIRQNVRNVVVKQDVQTSEGCIPKGCKVIPVIENSSSKNSVAYKIISMYQYNPVCPVGYIWEVREC